MHQATAWPSTRFLFPRLVFAWPVPSMQSGSVSTVVERALFVAMLALLVSGGIAPTAAHAQRGETVALRERLKASRKNA